EVHPQTADDRVVPQPAAHRVGAGRAVDGIQPGAAEQRVGELASDQRVVAGASVEEDGDRGSRCVDLGRAVADDDLRLLDLRELGDGASTGQLAPRQGPRDVQRFHQLVDAITAVDLVEPESAGDQVVPTEAGDVIGLLAAQEHVGTGPGG